MAAIDVPAALPHQVIAVMGVTGVGKTTVGMALAARLGATWIEGDRYHSAANRAKMAAGVALTDADREPWLDALADAVVAAAAHGPVVFACSALRRVYRNRLCARVPGLRFVFLDADDAIAVQRAGDRVGHFAPAALVASQVATLERPDADEPVMTVNANFALDVVMDEIAQRLAAARH